jgi:hypothetical protein
VHLPPEPWIAWTCCEIEPFETRGSIRAIADRVRHGIRQKAVVVYAKQRKTAIKAEGEMVTRILTVLYFERSPARRNKGQQLKRNDQTAKQVVVEVARTVVVLKGNSVKEMENGRSGTRSS